MPRRADRSRFHALRLLITLGTLIGALMTWSFGPAIPAHADDPNVPGQSPLAPVITDGPVFHGPVSPAEPVEVRDHRGEEQPQRPPGTLTGTPIVRDHRIREDPDARLQIVFRSVKVIDDHDWGRGEFRFLLWFWRVNGGCPPDAISKECNTTLLRHETVQLSTDDGGTLVYDQTIPAAGYGTQVLEPSIGPDIGIPVWADHAYGMAIAGNEIDAVRDDDMGHIEVVVAAADNWRIGTWTERSQKDPDSGCDIFGCDFTGRRGDAEVTYEIRLAPLPDLTPTKIEKVALTGTTNDGVCMDVGNAGPVDAGPFQVVLRIDDTPAPNGLLQAGGLPAGKIGTFCTETSLPTSGQHRLSAAVDEARAVLEQRETNNRLEQTLNLTPAGSTRPQGGPGPVVAGAGPANDSATPTPSPAASPSPARPDLTVSAIRVNGQVPDGKDDCKDGKNDVIVVVKNSGTANAGASIVRLLVDGANDQTSGKSVPGLDAGQEREVRFDDVRLKKGEHKLEATADAEKTVAESDEGNNARTVTARCNDDD
jgi:hypothetical protein